MTSKKITRFIQISILIVLISVGLFGIYQYTIKVKNLIIQTDSDQAEYFLYNSQKNTAVKLFSNTPEQYGGVWTADGSLFAFIRKGVERNSLIIYQTDLEGQSTVVWDATNTLHFSVNYIFTWSPDNEHVYFAAKPEDETTSRIYDLDILKKEYSEVSISNPISADFYLTLSISVRNEMAAGEDGKIYLLDPISGSTQYLVDGNSPIWDKKGDNLIYRCTEKSDLVSIVSSFCKYNLESRSVIQYLHFPTDVNIDSTRGISLSGDGRFITFVDTIGYSMDDQPKHISVYDTWFGIILPITEEKIISDQYDYITIRQISRLDQ